jgi:HIV Tat-specific factor 1
LEDSQNTKVYVSNLPTDITEDEFIETMQKCGLVVKDTQTGQPKIKLYEDSNGKKKGDGLCSYIKIESVQLALQILDGSDLRGNTIKVERARFQLKGQYDPTKKPKQKKRKDKEKMKKKQESLFAWQPDKLRGERGKNERVVIVQNAFAPEDFDKDVGLILEYQQDFREEAGKCGKCKKVVIFDRHPEGVMQIYMTTPEEADAVVTLFNNRFFGGKRISAFLWDGVTKYKIEETDAQREERLKKWENFIAEPESSAAGGASGQNVQEDESETPPATPPYVGDEDEGSD